MAGAMIDKPAKVLAVIVMSVVSACSVISTGGDAEAPDIRPASESEALVSDAEALSDATGMSLGDAVRRSSFQEDMSQLIERLPEDAFTSPRFTSRDADPNLELAYRGDKPDPEMVRIVEAFLAARGYDPNRVVFVQGPSYTSEEYADAYNAFGERFQEIAGPEFLARAEAQGIFVDIRLDDDLELVELISTHPEAIEQLFGIRSSRMCQWCP